MRLSKSANIQLVIENRHFSNMHLKWTMIPVLHAWWHMMRIIIKVRVRQCSIEGSLNNIKHSPRHMTHNWDADVFSFKD